MVSQTAYQLVYLAAVAYAAVWIVNETVRLAKRRGHEFGKGVARTQTVLRWTVACSGVLAGGACSFWIEPYLGKEGILLIVLALIPILERVQSTTNEARTLAVLVFFHCLSRVEGIEFFERLGRALDELPSGEIQVRLRAMLHGWSSGQNAVVYLAAIRSADSLLDELFLALEQFDFRMNAGTQILLERLIARAGKRWDRDSHSLLLKRQFFLALSGLKAGLLVFLMTAILHWPKAMPKGWLGMDALLWFGLALAALVFLVWLSLRLPVVKTAFAAICLLAGLALYIPSVRPPDLASLGAVLMVPGPSTATFRNTHSEGSLP